MDQHGIERVSGTCLRQSWYRLSGQFQSSGTSPYSEWIFALGKAVEEILVEQWKQMGIWVANNVKFYDKERNISGEVDVVLAEPDGTLYGVEAKSFYGYMATRDLLGNKKIQGRPKTSQLLQTLVYVDLCKRLGIIEYFKMVYYARDSAGRTEFDIGLLQDGEHLRPTVDDVIDYRFTMEDIYDRYAELAEYVEKKEPPPQDFEKTWDHDKVKLRRDVGDVSKSAFEKWQRSPGKYPIGDWQCRYCNYAGECWSK
jgi:hypothetical protein